MPSKEVNPEGGEGKAAKSGEEGHRAGEVHVPVEHCRLDKKSWYWEACQIDTVNAKMNKIMDNCQIRGGGFTPPGNIVV